MIFRGLEVGSLRLQFVSCCSGIDMFTEGLDPSALQWIRQGTELTAEPPPLRDPPLRPPLPFASRRAVSVNPGFPPLPKPHLHSSFLTTPRSPLPFSESFNGSSSDDPADSSPLMKPSELEKEHFRVHQNGNSSVYESYYYYDERISSSRPDSDTHKESRDDEDGQYIDMELNSETESSDYNACLHGKETEALRDGQEQGCTHGGAEAQRYFQNMQPAYNMHPSSSTQSSERYADQVSSVANAGSHINSFYQGHCSFPETMTFKPDSHIDNGESTSSPDKLGVSPSAPPLMSSGVVGTSAEANSNISAQVNSHSSRQGSEIGNSDGLTQSRMAFTSETIQRHTVPSQPEFSARTGSPVAVKCTFKETATKVAHPSPVFLSGQAAWQAIIAYDGCVRLCLRAWARGCMVEAPEFLRHECLMLRNAFGLQSLVLQPHEEIAQRSAADDDTEAAAGTSKPRRELGKIKVQVRKLKTMLKVPPRCSFPSFGNNPSSNIRSTIMAGWAAVRRVQVIARQVLSSVSSQQGTTYMQAGAQYMRQVPSLLKAGVSTLRNSAMAEASQESYSCLLRLKSTPETEAVRLQAGSGEMHIFHPESPGDDLILEVQDSNGSVLGRVSVQLISLNDDPNDRVRWWSLYNEAEHECVGKVQLFIDYSMNCSEVNSSKWGPVGETLAYDIVLDAAMRTEQWGRKNLRLHGPWCWLLSEFALFYGVSNAYTNLRYLSCIMEVATPTADCLSLIYDLLCPIVRFRDENKLNRQEKRILFDVEDQVEQLLALVFENYKSLDESLPSGMAEVFSPACGKVAPALVPAVQIFILLHDILSSEAQMILCTHFQTAAKKRCRRYMAETDEFISSNNEGILMDPMIVSTAYLKMKTLCTHICNEIHTDIEIHNQHVLPSSIDLSNIAASIYCIELSNRLRAFLVSCPPTGPSQPVVELMLATADFQRDLCSWNISAIKGGVDAKELFHLYILLWIQDTRLHLLDFCKLDKVRWAGATTQYGTSPFVEEIYERIKETLNEYEVIVNRWPEYTFALESAVADVEAAIITALVKQYADVLAPLKEVLLPKKFGLQYMQKLTMRRTLAIYIVPNQMGVLLNTMKRVLDILRPKIEIQMKSWVACLPVQGGGGNLGFGERLNEVTVILRTKYKNFLQAIVEKLADNTRMQRTTKLKRILEDTREAGGESEIRERMQPLNNQLMDTINHLHDVFSLRVFVAICRGYWDRMGRDVLQFLENRKENRSWYKGSCIALTILDDIFISQMQRLQGHSSLQEKDLELPRSVMEAHSMLSKDAPNGLDSSNYFDY